MSCNKNTKKCNIQKGQNLNQCCKDYLVELLRVIDGLFAKHEITYWLDYGTLLGATRKGNVIPYDDDGDIGILRQDLHKVLSLSDELRLMGYHLVSWFYPNFLRLDLSRINELHIDIFVWDIKPMNFKEMWEHESQVRLTTCMYRQKYIPGKDETKGKHFPMEYLFPLTKINFSGMMLPAPNNPKRFCQFRYGGEWQIDKRGL
jgi:phosphorylcholine metabolism protein LicD